MLHTFSAHSASPLYAPPFAFRQGRKAHWLL